MSRILFSWELGGNLGHITSLVMLARALRARGHEVAFALKHLRGAAGLLKQHGFAFFQAPVVPAHAADLPRDPASYAEIMLLHGFGDAEGLISATLAWRNLFGLLRPDLIVFDHSPGALFAARGLGLPRVRFGMGFCSPPRIAPMPGIRPWQRIAMQRLETSERRALATANAALQALGAKPVGALYELFQAEEDILATLPELDHYRGRHDARYWGPVYDNGEGAAADWPDGAGKKIFVYVRPESQAFRPLAAALRNTALPIIWFAPGLAPQAIEKLQTPSMRFALRPLDISRVAASADGAILHAGHGTAAAMLLGGVPMLLLPEHVEQVLVARNVVALGAGAIVPPRAMRAGLEQVVSRFLGNEEFRERAKSFAGKYKGFDQKKQVAGMVGRIEQLAKGKIPAPVNPISVV